jgi:hypothetical protein
MHAEVKNLLWGLAAIMFIAGIISGMVLLLGIALR